MDIIISEFSKGDIKDLSFTINGKTISLTPEQIESLKKETILISKYIKNTKYPDILKSTTNTLTNIAKGINMKGGSMDNSLYEQMQGGFINSEYSELQMNNDTLSLTEFHNGL